MGLRYQPRFSIGKNIRISKTGVSFLTGVPGLTYRHKFNSGNSQTQPDSSPQYKLPNTKDAIVNVIVLAIVLLILVAIGATIWRPLGYIIPLFFLGRAYKPLFQEYNYGLKKEAYYKTDRRYKDGRRYEGTQLVEDPDNKIYFTPEQRTIARIEGSTKVFIIGLAIMFVALLPDKVITKPNAPLTIKNLTIGDPLQKVKQQEKAGLKSLSDSWYYVENASYAKQHGQMDFYLEKGTLKEIKFTPKDTASYQSLSKLLFAKYGAAQDTSKIGVMWKNDSLSLELSRFSGVHLQLKKVGLFN